MSEADDWVPVKQAAEDDDWVPVGLAERPAPTVGDALPEAFLDRLRAGQALSRITSAAIEHGKEGFGQATPTGFSDETLSHLVDAGVFHDPAKGRAGPIQFMNETALMPMAQAWQAITGGINSGIYAAGGAIGQAVEEFGGSQGTGNRAKNEIINLSNWAMIESGMGRFSRPSIVKDAQAATSGEAAAQQRVMDKTIGGLPTPDDFSNAGKVLESPHAEANLKRMWQEDGIHPAEAVHDAEADAFLKHDITAPRQEITTYGTMELPIDVKLNEDKVVGTKSIDVTYGDPANAQGQIVGNVHGDTIQVKLSTMGEESRGQGVGVAMYEKLLQYADENGLKVVSDKEVSPAAARVYDALERRGYEVKRNPAELGEDGKLTAKGPVFEVSGKPEAVAKFDVKPEEMEQAFGEGASLSAAITPPEEIPLAVQPASPPGSLAASFQVAADKLFDLGRDVQMKLAPMATGTRDSMAMVKDYANAMRRNRWDWSRIDTDLAKRFSPEARARMWGAADEESVSRQLGEPEHMREHQGLATLDPAERALVEDLHERAQNAWVRARDAGMVDGEGLPAYTPRMVVNAVSASAKEGALPLNSIGRDMKTRTGNMLKRKYTEAQETEAAAKAKYGDAAMLARDIRVLPLAVGQLEDAIAGRTLINNIKAYGERTGTDTVAEGVIPAGSDTKWFTLDHPAFKTWRPKMETVDGVVRPIKDSAGEIVFEQVPLYVHGDFEGPLRAVLSGKSGPLYQGMMALKGKTMSLIMNSPLIHNAVEFGRAFPAMPTRIVKAYFDGNRAKNNVPLMHEAIDAGLVPIGKRFFNQDINSIMESPDLTPGRSWTAKLLAAVPGLFDEAAGTAVKRAIDKAGDVWHNKLLWDRIADLQMGLYTNFRSDMIAKGIDQQTSSRVAAHLANRYAGALPKEAMSEGATKAANLLLFSRTFTMGNIGVLKDMFTGMPKDVLAQIERDAGTVDPAAAGYAKSLARRKAIATVVMDVGLMYAGNAILQSAFNVMLGDRTLSEEAHGYVKRVRDQLNEGNVNPLSLLLHASPTSENEPGKQDRVYIGNGKDGTAIYARNPVGKIGEEFTGYLSGPLDMLRRKEGTIARPLLQIYSNDKGFGRKIYDPDADTPARYAGNIWNIVKHVAASQLPAGQIGAFSDLVKGEGDPKINALQAFGPIAGVTFAKGAPGGMDVGEMYHAKTQHDYAVNQAMPDIRRQILRGDLPGAQTAMDQLGIDKGYQRWITKTTLNPRTRMGSKTMRDFYNYSTPEQKRRMEGYLDRFGPQ